MVESTATLEALVLLTNVTMNSVLLNNAYFSNVKESFPKHGQFVAKLQSAHHYFSSPFDLKKTVALQAFDAVLKRECMKKQKRDVKAQMMHNYY